MTSICSNNLNRSKKFYTELFDLKVEFESDWFILLVSLNQKLELGIIERTNEIVPKNFQKLPQGFYITFVVNDSDEYFEKAKKANFEIVSEPLDTFYGQRRFLLKDPDGTLVDVSSPIEDFVF